MPSRNKVEIVITAKDQASKGISQAFSAVQDSGKKLAIGIGAIAAAAGAATVALGDMARESAASINVQNAFEGVVESTGQSMDTMLAALERGSAGMVDQTSLMKTYNTAAQLVSTTFANQLPDAMSMLSKVAAATGEDMDYMLESLVRGVGRLSPMILDNLGIQVDLTQAYEDYASSVGKSVDKLSKQEQQTALMNQVMKKLADNTAAMPDVTDSAAATFARFDAQMSNLRDTIGRAVIPIFTRLASAIEPVLGMVDALITGDLNARNLAMMGMDEAHPIISFFFALRDAFMAIAAGVPVVDVLLNMLRDLSLSFQGWGLESLIDLINQIWMVLYQVVRPIQEWINENIKLEDVLIAVGIALSTFIIPALIGIAGGIASVLAPIALLTGAIALLRTVWDEDIGGIRTFVLEQLIPAFQRLYDWFITEGWPMIQQRIQQAYELVIKPVFDFIAAVWTQVQPALSSLYNWFVNEGLPQIVEFIGRIKDWISENPKWVTAIALATGVLLALKVAASLATIAQTGLNTAVNLANGFKVGIANLGSLLLQLGAVTLAIYAVITAWNKMQETIDAVRQSGEAAGEALAGAVASGQVSAEDITVANLAAEFREGVKAQFGGGLFGDIAAALVPNLPTGGELIRSNANGGIYTSPGVGLIGEDLSGMSFEAVLNSDQIRELLAEARQGGSTTNNYFQGGPRNALEAQRYGNTIGTTLKAQGF